MLTITSPSGVLQRVGQQRNKGQFVQSLIFVVFIAHHGFRNNVMVKTLSKMSPKQLKMFT